MNISVTYLYCFFFNDQPTPEIYPYSHTLALRDTLPICLRALPRTLMIKEMDSIWINHLPASLPCRNVKLCCGRIGQKAPRCRDVRILLGPLSNSIDRKSTRLNSSH